MSMDSPSQLYDKANARYPVVSDTSDGRIILDDVPNTGSISASVDDYEVLPGIRDVLMSDFYFTGKSYSVQGNNRIKALVQSIKNSNTISPLIIVVENEGPYILEGSHRSEALFVLGAKTFPALVVVNMEEPSITASSFDILTKTASSDEEYMKAAEAGDVETCQRMVDEAAKNAGHTTLAFKGMPSNDWRTGKLITMIRSANGDWAGFFSDDKAVAEKFRNAFATMGEARTLSVYLDMSGAEVIDANGQRAREMQFDNVSPVDSSPQLLAKIKASSRGLVIKNTADEGTVYVPKSPHQVKSADAITRDGSGNIIPLNQRFNSSSSDIRFEEDAPIITTASFDILTKTASSDEEYLKAAEAGNVETCQKMVNEAAKAAGYTIGPVWHGSGVQDIRVFDPGKAGSVQRSDWGKGIYFTPSEWQANSYRIDAVKLADQEEERLYKEFEDKAHEFGTTPMNMSIDLGTTSEKYKELNEYSNRWLTYRRGLDKTVMGKTYGVFIKMSHPMTYQADGMTDPFLSDQAKSKNHDGIIITREDGSLDELLVFSSSQIKSADPITRDQAGNVIPLSQRFNSDSSDIHFKDDAPIITTADFDILTKTASSDDEYMKAVSADDMETCQRMVDEAAKEAGYTIGPVWHGSMATEPFSVFNTRRNRNANRLGSYFTEKESFARNPHGSKAMTVYKTMLGIKKPLDLRGMNRVQIIDALSWMGSDVQHDLEIQGRAGQYAVLEWADNKHNLVPLLKSKGYDGIVFENPTEGRTWVAFNPKQIKAAEPVTYDDNGNVIPLNQRFNSSSSDIRFEEDAPIITTSNFNIITKVALNNSNFVNSPAFKLWFGNSKVVNKNGEPLVVYHGTQNNIATFNVPAYFSESEIEAGGYSYAQNFEEIEQHRKKYSEASGIQYAGQRFRSIGIFGDIPRSGREKVWATDQGVGIVHSNGQITIFNDVVIEKGSYNIDDDTVLVVEGKSTAYEQEALEMESFIKARYKERTGEGGSVYPVYLSIQNPKEMGPMSGNRFSKRLRMGDDEYAIIEKLKSEGYDGIFTDSDEASMFPEVAEMFEGKIKQYIPFYPYQIKSAIGNSGLFDHENADIVANNFNIIVKTASSDDKYMQLVESGDMDACQRMVNEAATSAGYTIQAWHGTRSEEKFTTFHDNHKNKQSQAPTGTYFFSGDSDVAFSYAGDSDSVFKVFLKIDNPFYFDFQGADWQGDLYGKFEADNDGEIRYFKNWELADDWLVENGVENPSEYIRQDPWVGHTTNSAVLEAKQDGHDGAIMDNVIDNGSYSDPSAGTVYVVFSSSQIKSAEPVTYDESENVIPLSQRFNSSSADIRFKEDAPIITTAMNTKRISPTLSGLAAEALKCSSFEEFERAFLGDIKHGTYWHWTDDPNFVIDPSKGPRDMSSLAAGKMDSGKLMVTSDLGAWESYGNRPYVALIDLSDVDPKDYMQVKRGFGNEFIVTAPSRAKVTGVYPKAKAFAIDRRINKKIPQSQNELRAFYDNVHPQESEENGVNHLALGFDVMTKVASSFGTSPVPEGNIRLYHYTRNNSDGIAENGIKLSYAKGETYGEPNMIWASSVPMTEDKTVIEFTIPANDPALILDAPKRGEDIHKWNTAYHHVGILRDIMPNEILEIHEPWDSLYQTMLDTPDFADRLLSGEFNYITEDKYPLEYKAIQSFRKTMGKQVNKDSHTAGIEYSTLLKTARHGGSEQERSLWFHGTSSSRISSILSSGLIPNPSTKTWEKDDDSSFNSPSRVSFGGVYLTDNLLLARSSASNATSKNEKSNTDNGAIVICEMQPRSLIMDEDHMLTFNLQFFTPTPWVCIDVFLSKKLNVNNTLVDYYRDQYINNVIKSIKDSFTGAKEVEGLRNVMDNRLEKRIKELLTNGWESALNRQAAHAFIQDPLKWYDRILDTAPRNLIDKIKTEYDIQISDSLEKRKLYYQAIRQIAPPPSVAESETAYAGYVDNITKSLKILARPTVADKFMHTARSLDPIGFSGKNKIVCIVEYIYNRRFYNDHHERVKIVYGELPDSFKKAWTKEIGELMIVDDFYLDKDVSPDKNAIVADSFEIMVKTASSDEEREKNTTSFDPEYPTYASMINGVQNGELLVHCRKLEQSDLKDLQYGLYPSIGETVLDTEAMWEYNDDEIEPVELLFASDDLSWAQGTRNGIVFILKEDFFQKSLGNNKVQLSNGDIVPYERSPVADFENPFLKSEPRIVETDDWYSKEVAEVVGVCLLPIESDNLDNSKNIPQEKLKTTENNLDIMATNWNFLIKTASYDEEYMKAAKAKDISTCQKLVNEAANAAGYNIGPVRHGTSEIFNSFDKGKGGSITDARSAKRAFFFVDDERVAQAYATYSSEEKDIKAALRNADIAERKQDWDKYNFWIGEAEKLDTPDTRTERRVNSRVVNAYLKGKFFEFDAEGKTPQELSENGEMDTGLSAIISKAKRNGYTGVIFKNLDDAVGLSNATANHYAVFNPEQIKASDPITYDNSRNIIPLSQRFNSSFSDIRFEEDAPIITTAGFDITNKSDHIDLLKMAQEDYKGEHEAPDHTSGYPLHDLSGVYPDDIYGENGARYYGQGDALDSSGVAIMKMYHGRPNSRLQVYRAVPNLKKMDETIEDLEAQKRFILKHGKIPNGVEPHGENSSIHYDWLCDEIERRNLLPPVEKTKASINPGDWVTTIKEYAKEHGESNLLGKYKILSKSVYARDLFTTGDSIFEWGYDPQPAVPRNRKQASFNVIIKSASSDEDYFSAVESEDLETCQRMTDEAAKNAGYTIGPVYHGTSQEGLTTFFGGWWSERKNVTLEFGNECYTAYIKGPLADGEDLRKLYIQFNETDIDPDSGYPLSENELGDYAMSGGPFSRFIQEKGVIGIEVFDESNSEDAMAYSVFDSENVKSADPITYDDFGNVISLSQRFNSSSSDIRFEEDAPIITTAGSNVTMKPASSDEEYIQAAESGDILTCQLMVDETAKKRGMRVVYHGTDAENITNFKPREGRFGKAIYTATSRLRAKEYGKNVMRLYASQDASVYGPESDAIVYSSDPSNFKSADPIVRDNFGNIIPLSQRFNSSSSDIRFKENAPIITTAGFNIAIKTSGVYLTGYRNSASSLQGTYGTFYSFEQQSRPTITKTIYFDNLLEVPHDEAMYFEGLPSECLAAKWFPSFDFRKEANDRDMDDGEIMDEMVATEAVNRGYDGIRYGDLEFVDLHNFSSKRDIVKVEDDDPTFDVTIKTANNSGGVIAYHGTPTSFENFSSDFIGTGEDQLGSGFYFSSNKDNARRFAFTNEPVSGQKNAILTVRLDIKNPLDADLIGTINRKQIEKLISMSPNLEEALNNYGDVEFEGRNTILRDVIDNFVNISKGQNILRSLFPIANDFYDGKEQEFNNAVTKVLGYDGVVKHFHDTASYGDLTHYVAFRPEQVQIIDREPQPRMSNNDFGIIKLAQNEQSDTLDDSIQFFKSVTIKTLQETGFSQNIFDNSVLMYHGTSEKNAKKILAQGKFNGFPFFSSDKQVAEQFSRKYGRKPVVIDFMIDPSAILPTAGSSSKYFSARMSGLQLLKNNIWGYDNTIKQSNHFQLNILSKQAGIALDDRAKRAVENTPNTKLTDNGLEIEVQRNQHPDQAGRSSVRSGVFYQPSGSLNKYPYSGSDGYGGLEKIKKTLLLNNPLFVKGSTGGKAPQMAYDFVVGKGQYDKMGDEVRKIIIYNYWGIKISENDIKKIIDKYNGDSSLSKSIYNIFSSQKGNGLVYAIIENIVANAVKRAGYDAIVGYSLKRDGTPFLSEVFYLDELSYPKKVNASTVNRSLGEDSFLHGYCPEFSIALNKTTNWPIVVFNEIISEGKEKYKVLAHVTCLSPTGQYADAKGLRSEADVTSDMMGSDIGALESGEYEIEQTSVEQLTQSQSISEEAVKQALGFINNHRNLWDIDSKNSRKQALSQFDIVIEGKLNLDTGVDDAKAKGHLDTQLFPDCEGTKFDRDIVKKYRRRKNKKLASTQEERDQINDEMIKEIDAQYFKKWTPVESSAIREVAYNESIGKFEVRMNRSKIYTFIGVPRNEFDSFMESDSKGKWFVEFIKRHKQTKQTKSNYNTSLKKLAAKWGKAGSGVLYYCPEDNTIMLLERSSEVEDPELWGIPGGAVMGTEGMYDDADMNEDFDEDVLRSSANKETEEEIGHLPEGGKEMGSVTIAFGNFKYTTFLIHVNAEQKNKITQQTTLNWESNDIKWFPIYNLPKKLHPGVRAAIKKLFG